MPHLIIEYSRNLEEHHSIDALIERIHSAAVDHGLASLPALRTRATVADSYRIADGNPRYALLAITARIGPGRTPEQKQSFMAAVLDAAEAHIAAESDALEIAYSMEVQEINAHFRINRNYPKQHMEAGE